ncbi:MAG: CbiQ family ECF transporter T component, partial [Acidimicrobiales bacterium]
MSWHLPLDNESAARSPSARSARSNKQAQRQATRRRQLADLHVLRYVPGTSSLHRCWAGTKIVSLAALSIVIVLRPTWESVGIVAAVLLAGFLVAALPRGIAPRVPRWIFLLLAIGACLALVSGGAPYLHLG